MKKIVIFLPLLMAFLTLNAQSYTARDLVGTWEASANEFGTQKYFEWDIAPNLNTTIKTTIGYKVYTQGPTKLSYDNGTVKAVDFSCTSKVEWHNKNSFALYMVKNCGEETGLIRHYKRKSKTNLTNETSRPSSPKPSPPISDCFRYDISISDGCSFCNGTHRMNCVSCGGYGNWNCTSCGGLGTVRQQRTEYRYNYGTDRNEPYTVYVNVPCTRCYYGKIDCPACYDGKVECTHCDGRSKNLDSWCINDNLPKDECVFGEWKSHNYTYDFKKTHTYTLFGSGKVYVYDLYKKSGNNIVESGYWIIEEGVMKIKMARGEWSKYCVNYKGETMDFSPTDDTYFLDFKKLKRL